MTVWRITDGEDGVESGERASPGSGSEAAPGSGAGSGGGSKGGSRGGSGGDGIVELDTALLRITASTAAARLVMSGEIDVSNAGDVTRALEAAGGRSPGDVHVDLTDVDFVDVAGLRAFNLAARDLHETGRMLVLHAVSPHIDKLFGTIGWSTTPGLEIHCGPRA
ncbi:anti-sigma factor antagonist [Actinomadura sp. KC06]|uniref:STAS domain-containing protein n=1 Tax=Actinomadura sp. KC06 TaxID=2530369 RepID=UPI001052EF0C|nr:STAS domain-containing protein [Actinomadura sp. KC06]TDD35066.1 anti-sigma factor antagonist [Actinomadura sp. KC06]